MTAAENQKTFDPTKRALTLWEEFRAFAFKGNVIDLAIGVIIGAAFAKIVDSLVKHIIMPLIAAIPIGGKGYTEWKITIGNSEVLIGQFVGEVVNFLIVAAALFFFIRKFLGWVMRSREAEPAPPTPPLSKQEELLTEIRDLLKTSSGTPRPA